MTRLEGQDQLVIVQVVVTVGIAPELGLGQGGVVPTTTVILRLLLAMMATSLLKKHLQFTRVISRSYPWLELSVGVEGVRSLDGSLRTELLYDERLGHVAGAQLRHLVLSPGAGRAAGCGHFPAAARSGRSFTRVVILPSLPRLELRLLRGEAGGAPVGLPLEGGGGVGLRQSPERRAGAVRSSSGLGTGWSRPGLPGHTLPLTGVLLTSNHLLLPRLRHSLPA